ncbi:MAG: hypothetical protein V1774_04860 [Candidatus Eisenbacteria bacterium]
MQRMRSYLKRFDAGIARRGLVVSFIGGVLFLAIFSWAYSRIPGEYYAVRDDGVITLSHARNLVDHGFIGVGPSGERVEGYSAPVQFFVFAALYALSGVDYQSYAKIQTLALTFLLGFLFTRVLVAGRWIALGLAAAAALFLATRVSFIEWHGSGMENALTHVLILGTIGLLGAFFDSGELRYRWAIIPFLASISRVEGIYHIAPVLVVLAAAWAVAFRSWKGVPFSLLVLGYWGAFQLWRLAYFGDLLPNVAYAQGMQMVDRLRELIGVNGEYLRHGLELSGRILVAHGAYVLLPCLPLLTLVRWNRRTVVLLLMAFTLAAAGYGYPLLFGRTTLDPARSTTHVAIVFALAGAVILNRIRRGRVATCAALGILSAALGVHLLTAERPRLLCCPAADFETVHEELQRIALSEELPRPTVANPDLGAVSWHKTFNIVDLGQLGSPLLAKLGHGPLLADYFFEYAAPDLIESHEAWSRKYFDAVFGDPRFTERYAPVREEWVRFPRGDGPRVPVGIWVRKDIRKAAPSRERRLIDDLRRSLSVERVAEELAAGREDADAAYVARTAFRFLPEFAAAGDEERLVRAFAEGETRVFDQSLLAGRHDGRAHLAIMDFLLERYLAREGIGEKQGPPPLLSSRYDVHLTGGKLVYLCDSSDRRDRYSQFFVQLFSQDASIPTREWQFSFWGTGYQIGGRSLLIQNLPAGEFAALRTGPIDREGRLLWEGTARIEPTAGLGAPRSP